MLENLSKLPRLFKNKVLTIRWFLFLWRTTGKINYLRFLRKRFGIQLTAKQIAAILTHIRQKKDCKLLVFGLGNDSLLWAMANRHGKTVIVSLSGITSQQDLTPSAKRASILVVSLPVRSRRFIAYFRHGR
jgi:hypothetical protein